MTARPTTSARAAAVAAALAFDFDAQTPAGAAAQIQPETTEPETVTQPEEITPAYTLPEFEPLPENASPYLIEKRAAALRELAAAVKIADNLPRVLPTYQPKEITSDYGTCVSFSSTERENAGFSLAVSLDSKGSPEPLRARWEQPRDAYQIMSRDDFPDAINISAYKPLHTIAADLRRRLLPQIQKAADAYAEAKRRQAERAEKRAAIIDTFSGIPGLYAVAETDQYTNRVKFHTKKTQTGASVRSAETYGETMHLEIEMKTADAPALLRLLLIADEETRARNIEHLRQLYSEEKTAAQTLGDETDTMTEQATRRDEIRRARHTRDAETIAQTLRDLYNVEPEEIRPAPETGETAHLYHFTMTGFYAGTPYCNQPRNERDTYAHPAYSREGEAAQLARPDFCPACRAAYDEARAEIQQETPTPEAIEETTPEIQPEPFPRRFWVLIGTGSPELENQRFTRITDAAQAWTDAGHPITLLSSVWAKGYALYENGHTQLFEAVNIRRDWNKPSEPKPAEETKPEPEQLAEPEETAPEPETMPTVAEIEADAKAGKTISLYDLASAIDRERPASQRRRRA